MVRGDRYIRCFDVHSNTCTVTSHKDSYTVHFWSILSVFIVQRVVDVILNNILSKWAKFITSQTNRIIRVAILHYREPTLINNTFTSFTNERYLKFNIDVKLLMQRVIKTPNLIFNIHLIWCEVIDGSLNNINYVTIKIKCANLYNEM